MSVIILMVKLYDCQIYRDAFLEGQLHMKNLGFFKGCEDEHVANTRDPYEATHALWQPGQVSITWHGITPPAEDHIGPIVFQNLEQDSLNVFCVYAALKPDRLSLTEDEFEAFVEAQLLPPETAHLGQYAAIVCDTNSFHKKVAANISNSRFSWASALVDYYEPATYHGEFKAEEAVFKKRIEYAHQREYRYVINRGDTADGKPFNLEIGPLGDIGIACHQSEVNDLMRQYFYQKKDEGWFD